MDGWAEDLLMSMDTLQGEEEVLERIQISARSLGFEHCAYGMRLPLPLTKPRTILLNDYPQPWRDRYAEAGYLHIDPTVLHGRRSQVPLIWSDSVFADARDLWEEAQSYGLRVGWAQSSLDANGVGGMLTLSRSADPLSDAELLTNGFKMRWLVNIAHFALTRVLVPKYGGAAESRLSHREVEVLKWTADGKTSNEISRILSISMDTVNFHIKNATAKLKTCNKTAAVVRAAMLGILN